MLEMREKESSKNHQISILGFLVSSQNIEIWLKICTSHLVDSQIWLNLPRHDRHFFYIFVWIIATLARNKNFLKKILGLYSALADICRHTYMSLVWKMGVTEILDTGASVVLKKGHFSTILVSSMYLVLTYLPYNEWAFHSNFNALRLV